MVSRGRAPEQCTCHHTMSDITPWCHIMTQLSDPHDNSDDWISYEQFADERFNKHSQMLEQLELGPGPGPPFFDFPPPPDFFPPPPPIPGSVEECETFSSHFDHCDISKVSFISDGVNIWVVLEEMFLWNLSCCSEVVRTMNHFVLARQLPHRPKPSKKICKKLFKKFSTFKHIFERNKPGIRKLI